MHCFQGVVQNYCLEKLCFVKIGVFRKWVVAFFWGGGVGGGGDCYCMMLLDALEGCSKNPINILFFEHLVARCNKQKNIQEKAEKGNFLHPFLGAAYKGTGTCSTFFPHTMRIFKILKNPYFL